MFYRSQFASECSIETVNYVCNADIFVLTTKQSRVYVMILELHRSAHTDRSSRSNSTLSSSNTHIHSHVKPHRGVCDLFSSSPVVGSTRGSCGGFDLAQKLGPCLKSLCGMWEDFPSGCVKTTFREKFSSATHGARVSNPEDPPPETVLLFMNAQSENSSCEQFLFLFVLWVINGIAFWQTCFLPIKNVYWYPCSWSEAINADEDEDPHARIIRVV